MKRHILRLARDKKSREKSFCEFLRTSLVLCGAARVKNGGGAVALND
jgi:hypothetical protein